MKWYQQKEQAAGEKRLIILWNIYKFCGRRFVKFLVFFITFFAFLGAKEPRKYSKKYLSIMGLNSGIINQFKHILMHSYSLLDKMEVFAGTFKPENVFFDNENDKNNFIKDLQKGVFIIGSHLGNIEMMRVFLRKIYTVEEININTSIEIKEKISAGEVVVMAGDRISKNSTNIKVPFLGKTIQLPSGTFKFAYLMEHPVYFVCALKEGEKYRIYLRKFDFTGTKTETVKQMQQEYLAFLENLVPRYPFQFYHFYDFFE